MKSTVLESARRLVEAPSVTGEEGPALLVAEELFREAGLEVRRLPMDDQDDRWIVLGSVGLPRAMLLTHVDTVPGGPAPRLEGGVLHGRGSCDAKGILAAMIQAAGDVVVEGGTDVAVAAVVGEETTSDGAIRLDEALATGEVDWPLEGVLVGEPTENRWVRAHPGTLVLELLATGEGGHSSRPAEGGSAIDSLLDLLQALREEPWPAEDELGGTLLNIGRIEGGEAPNVLAPSARASLMMRSPADPAVLEERVRSLAGPAVTVEILCASPPVRFAVPASAPAPAEVVPFCTDAPFLRHAGQRYLLGPGSVRLAHTDQEHITGEELDEACRLYREWLLELSKGAVTS